MMQYSQKTNLLVEAAGIEPASRSATYKVATCLVYVWIFEYPVPTDRLWISYPK